MVSIGFASGRSKGGIDGKEGASDLRGGSEGGREGWLGLVFG